MTVITENRFQNFAIGSPLPLTQELDNSYTTRFYAWIADGMQSDSTCVKVCTHALFAFSHMILFLSLIGIPLAIWSSRQLGQVQRMMGINSDRVNDIQIREELIEIFGGEETVQQLPTFVYQGEINTDIPVDRLPASICRAENRNDLFFFKLRNRVSGQISIERLTQDPYQLGIQRFYVDDRSPIFPEQDSPVLDEARLDILRQVIDGTHPEFALHQ